MPVSSPRKALAAVATAMAFVAFMATPASADPPYELELTAGTLEIDSLGIVPDVDLVIGEEPEEDPCGLYDPGDPSSIEVDVAGSGPGYTTSIEPSTGTPPPNPTGQLGKSTFPFWGSWIQIDLDISDPAIWGADNTGTLTSTGPGTWTITQNVWIEARFYQVEPPECEKDDLVCSLLLVFDANVTSPLIGTYTGTVPPTSGTAISNLAGTGVSVVSDACDAALAGSFDGSTVTLTGGALAFVP